MEVWKKISILFFGAAIVTCITYLLLISVESPSHSSQMVAETLSKEQIFVPKQIQQPSGEDDEESIAAIVKAAEDKDDRMEAAEDPLTAEETSNPRNEEKTGWNDDTVSWKMADREKDAGQAVVSGKMPFYGDPNPIFKNAAKRILPTVVSIRSSRRLKSSDFFHPFRLPRKDKEEDNENSEEGEILQPGTGSGVIISSDGYIMTNNHVVEGTEELRVELFDKREFDAEFIGGDPTTDIAVLRIYEKDLPVAYIGNSDSVEIGEWVMAVGNPLSFPSTVTVGIVSALGRNIRLSDEKYRIENFIQTDAVINPGNSGGALINLKGEVVGINTAIATRTGLYQGYGFSIPINLARSVVDDLIKFGKVHRGLLGVQIKSVNDADAKLLGLEKPLGALIQKVQANSPAEKVGLRMGDVVMQVDGERVDSVNDLQIKIARHRPGDVVRLVIWRDREAWEVDVKLSEVPLDKSKLNSSAQRDAKNGKVEMIK